MLQQTQVATVIPYYKQFLSRFPTYIDLAKADLQEVFSAWQGLGYYRRARYLHEAAQLMCVEGFPKSYSEWIKMPGVGAYTAGAIASLAYGEKVPAVDGNVIRVLSRISCLEAKPPSLIHECEAISKSWMGKMNPRDWNQALMELGATICKSKKPKCTICPVQEHCKAFQQKNQNDYPKKRSKAFHKSLIHIVECPIKEKHVGLVENGHDKWWDGLWTFHRHELQSNENIDNMLRILGIKNKIPFAEYKHTVTNHKITSIAFLTDRLPIGGSWISLYDIDKIALPSADRFFANRVKKLIIGSKKK
jgi:A/G-specific adenine glycosylase